MIKIFVLSFQCLKYNRRIQQFSFVSKEKAIEYVLNFYKIDYPKETIQKINEALELNNSYIDDLYQWTISNYEIHMHS